MSFGTGDLPLQLPVPANSVVATNATDDAWVVVPYPGSITRSFSNPTRTLNTAFQISTSQDAEVSYSVDISTSVSLSGGAVGTVYLRYADDSGFTTSVVEVGRTVNGNTGTLVIGLTLNQTVTGQINGIVPSGKYVKLITENTTGTPTFSFRSSQEVLI